MNRTILGREANRHIGCLAHLRTTEGRRRTRYRPGETLNLPDPFLADEAKLASSKAVRLMAKKTQVATAPLNPFVRNRMTHVLEVISCSVVLANALGLNESLAHSIAFGHDIGHVPFGHQGEDFMKHAMGRPAFCHEVMAPVIAQRVERKGRGLNLTFETLDGMMRHSGATAREGMTQEAWVVRYADKFAYIFADYNDIVRRMGYPESRELHLLMKEFGQNQRQRTTTAMAGLIVESVEAGKVSFEQSEIAQKFAHLRKLMYEIYPRVATQNVDRLMTPVLEFLGGLRLGDPFLLLALMTDHDVMYLSGERVPDMGHLRHTALWELLPHLGKISPPEHPIDLCNPELDW